MVANHFGKTFFKGGAWRRKENEHTSFPKILRFRLFEGSVQCKFVLRVSHGPYPLGNVSNHFGKTFLKGGVHVSWRRKENEHTDFPEILRFR